MGERQTLLLLAADHTARGQHQVGTDHSAMTDRDELLNRLRVALNHDGVDGLLGTADIIEDLALLGALDGKIVFGSMNRGGLAGSVFELDDRFTGYTVAGIKQANLDGGKMMLRVSDDDSRTAETLQSCARAINELAENRLPAMVEVFPVSRRRRLAPDDHPARLARALTIVSGLGTTSAYTWLKVPAVDDMSRVVAATTLPVFLLGGDPGPNARETYDRWERAMTLPQVRGLVVGRALLYPSDDNVAQAVDTAVTITSGNVATASLTSPPRPTGKPSHP